VTEESAFDSADTKVAVAFCPAGTSAVGGGAHVTPPLRAWITASVPEDHPDSGWAAAAGEVFSHASPWKVVAHVICADVDQGRNTVWFSALSAAPSPSYDPRPELESADQRGTP
jgi:hypothetical protein